MVSQAGSPDLVLGCAEPFQDTRDMMLDGAWDRTESARCRHCGTVREEFGDLLVAPPERHHGAWAGRSVLWCQGSLHDT
ncbi:hypothetical protein [Streptomyces sp. RKAG337]|uniref:hypothetical protein n=1 Tax=Streptomyces sp. RKAG337 TaxID=2893404 RepID=UPI002033273D|nr:hypothetical protein [Streptomyces sp. RKAG337]MCM2424937.1 hypothetical protein [Streptomyces sp. RKAG337]